MASSVPLKQHALKPCRKPFFVALGALLIVGCTSTPTPPSNQSNQSNHNTIDPKTDAPAAIARQYVATITVREITQSPSVHELQRPTQNIAYQTIDHAGIIAEWLVNKGDYVSRGQTIARLNVQAAEQTLKQNQAGLERVQADYLRASQDLPQLTELHKNGIISDKEFSQYQASLQQLQSSIDTMQQAVHAANNAITNNTITSTQEGVILDILQPLGKPIAAGDKVAQIHTQANSYLIEVNESDSHLAVGSDINIREISMTNAKTITARIRQIHGNSLTIEVSKPLPHADFFAEIPQPSLHILPPQAIQHDGENNWVWVSTDKGKTAHKQQVTIIALHQQQIRVGGLDSGMEVVIPGSDWPYPAK